MNRFVFSLESVLQLRVHAEQHCQRALAVAQSRAAELERQLTKFESRLAAAGADLQACLRSATVDPAELATHVRYKHDLVWEIEQLQADLTSARSSAEQAKAELLAAATQRKSLEKLRERQREQWRTEQHRRERLAHDDLATRDIAQSA